MAKIYHNLDGIEKNFPELYGDKNSAEQLGRYERCFSAFKSYYGEKSAYIASSGGRIEICGNHTDHNGGKAVVAAISLDALAFFLPTDDFVVTIYSEGYGEFTVDTQGDFSCEAGTPGSLVCGVCLALIKNGFKVGGFKAYVSSNVLSGSGVSSSASFEVLICEILNFLYNDGKISAKDKAKFSQYAENVCFGKPCGLLDQTAIAFGGLKMLDFNKKNDVSVTDIKNDLSDYTVVLINTGGSHADLTDEYAAIPKEMKEVAACFGKERLIEVPEQDFIDGLRLGKVTASGRAINRAMHFYEENGRAETCACALNSGDYASFLQAVKESGISSLCKLQNCYVAGSTDQPIPNALFITAKYLKGGVNRVHGGGFAGTILNIVENGVKEEFVKVCEQFYKKENVIPLKIRSVGTKVL